MAGETTVTVVGNLVADPELRFTPSGAAVASFTVACTPRHYDRNSQEWKDGDAAYWRCSLWRAPAEHAVESLTRGARVIVTGRLRQRSYEDREGVKRTVTEVEVDEIGASLRYATAKITRAARRSDESPATDYADEAWNSASSEPPATESAGSRHAEPVPA
jgi:single-strand DNA-binding protein